MTKICTRHPALLGRRHENGRCPACASESSKKSKLKKKIKIQLELKKVRQKIYGRERTLALLQRTPVWADLTQIESIFNSAKIAKLVVDHVIPLRGYYVSGLHVHYNLQLVPPNKNFEKSNMFNPQESLVNPAFLLNPHPVYIRYWISRQL